MASKIATLLNLSPDDQRSIARTSGRIRSVAEFVSDVVKATKETQFIEALAKSTPWWLQAVGQSAAEAAPPIKFLATLIGKLGEIKDPDRLAFVAFTTAYQRSLEKALITVGAPASRKKSQSKWKPENDIKTPDEGMSFREYSITDPFNHQFLKEAKVLTESGLKAGGYTPTQRRKIQNEVLIRFPGCLKSLISHPSTREKYAAFADALQQGSTEDRVHSAWIDHFEFQRFLFEEQPMFGEEPFTLSDIYVDTECGILTCEELRKGIQTGETDLHKNEIGLNSRRRQVDPFDEESGGRNDLLKSVMDLIGEKSFKDAIIVQGPAGSGKSAFTIRLAMELLRNGLNPIRIRFRDIPLALKNIEDALPDSIRFWDAEQRPDDLPAARPDELFLNMALFDQKVEFNDSKICSYVLIIDGWDEVSVAAQKGFAVRIEEILSQIRDRFLNRVNRPIVRVILTGRPSSAVSESTFLTKQTRLLTIRPLRPKVLRSFMVNLAPRLADPKEPDRSAPKRFDSILAQYKKEFEHRTKGETEAPNADRKNSMEVLGLPLLTHLAVRLMVRWPDTELTPLVENPTTLYRELTNLTCEKGGRYGKEVFDPGVPGEDLRALLHDTAAAMTVFGRDSIPYDELDTRLSQMNEELLARVQRVTKEHPVTSLMINFFFKGGRTELGAEFLHKSFREFLFAEAVVEALKEYAGYSSSELEEQPAELYGSDFDEADPRYRFSRKLSSLLGPQWLTREVCVFIEGLLKWELERAHGVKDRGGLGSCTQALSLDGWKLIADGLADIWNWWGEGVHLRTQPEFLGKKIKGWRPPYVDEVVHWAMPQDPAKDTIPVAVRTASIDGHLGDAICRLALLVHHYVAVAPNDRTPWEDFDEEASEVPVARRYQRIGRRNGEWALRFAPSGTDPSFFFYYAARINAVGWYPEQIFPSRVFMESADLAGDFLCMMGFAGTRLRGVNLSRANLIGTYFNVADLRSADLRDAFIRETAFRSSLMSGARLKGIRGFDDIGAENRLPKELISAIEREKADLQSEIDFDEFRE